MLLQQVGDWTASAFRRAALRPRGSVLAQDFYQMGILPADTDYRMFSYRHYGSLPGELVFLLGGWAGR